MMQGTVSFSYFMTVISTYMLHFYWVFLVIFLIYFDLYVFLFDFSYIFSHFQGGKIKLFPFPPKCHFPPYFPPNIFPPNISPHIFPPTKKNYFPPTKIFFLSIPYLRIISISMVKTTKSENF